MDGHHLVTVLIPAYNVEKWIRLSVESILQQSYKYFEILIINDGSTDQTSFVLDEIALLDDRIRVLHNINNMGIVATLNRGLLEARGDYIARMDADDIAESSRLEKQLKFLKNHPDYALVGSQMVSMDENGIEYGVTRCPVLYENAQKIIRYSSPVAHIWLCHRDIYTKLGGYRELAPAEDYDFLLRMDTFGLKYGNHPEVLMKIRSREGNTASTDSLKQRKAHNYVFSLYQERLNFSKDSYAFKYFEESVQSGWLIKKIHDYSSKLLAQSIQSSNQWMRCLYVLFSAILSPYNAQYIWRRLMYRWYLMKERL
jgi:glycosyltransferase involved in cell wall biosynthesis